MIPQMQYGKEVLNAPIRIGQVANANTKKHHPHVIYFKVATEKCHPTFALNKQ